jgi:hypothetical protein
VILNISVTKFKKKYKNTNRQSDGDILERYKQMNNNAKRVKIRSIYKYY